MKHLAEIPKVAIIPRARIEFLSPHSARYSAADNLNAMFRTALELRKNFETLQEDRKKTRGISPRRSRVRRRRSTRRGEEGRWAVRSSRRIPAPLSGRHLHLRRICRHFSEISCRRNRSKRRVRLAQRKSRPLAWEFIRGFPTSTPSSDVALL